MRHRLFSYLILLSLILSIYSCNGKRAGNDNFVINGTLYNSKETKLYLEELSVENNVVIDSVDVAGDGTFSFSYKPEQIGFYFLRIDKNNFVTLLLDKGETLTFTADVRHIADSYSVEGSEGSALIRKINKKLITNYARVDSLSEEFEKSRYKEDFIEIKGSIDSMYYQIVMDQRNFVKNFIDSNLTSLASIIALYQTFGQEPLLSEGNDFAYFEKLSESLIAEYPDNIHSKDLYNKVTEIRTILNEKMQADERLAIGKIAPEITLNNPQSVPVSLSSLKGKYVLIDFWASWCAPCRAQLPSIKKVYQKYNAKGFEIFAVSIDREKTAWINTIESEKLSWVNVSDLLYWQSPVVQLYNIEGIPFNYLLDKEGHIIIKNVTPEELDIYLKEHLN